MKKLRIFTHECRTDQIRIGAAFCKNTRSLSDVAEEVRRSYAKDGLDDLSKYYHEILIIDADTLERLYIIYADHGSRS